MNTFRKKGNSFGTHKFLEQLRYACKRAICVRSEMALTRVHACLGVRGEKGEKVHQTIEALAVSLRARLHQNAGGRKVSPTCERKHAFVNNMSRGIAVVFPWSPTLSQFPARAVSPRPFPLPRVAPRAECAQPLRLKSERLKFLTRD